MVCWRSISPTSSSRSTNRFCTSVHAWYPPNVDATNSASRAAAITRDHTSGTKDMYHRKAKPTIPDHTSTGSWCLAACAPGHSI